MVTERVTVCLRTIEKINICMKFAKMKFKLLMKIWDSVYIYSSEVGEMSECGSGESKKRCGPAFWIREAIAWFDSKSIKWLTPNTDRSIHMLFFYLAFLQSDGIVTSQCVQFIFGDKGE